MSILVKKTLPGVEQRKKSQKFLSGDELTTTMLAKELKVSLPTVTKHKEAFQEACSTFREVHRNGQHSFFINRSDLENARTALLHNKPNDDELTTLMLAEEMTIDVDTVLRYRKSLQAACSTFRELTISGRPTFVINRSDLENARKVLLGNRPTEDELTPPMLAKRLGIVLETVLKNSKILQENCSTFRASTIKRPAFFINCSDLENARKVLPCNKPNDDELTTVMLAKELGINTMTVAKYKERLKATCSTFREVFSGGHPTFVIGRSDLENARNVLLGNRPTEDELTPPMLAKRLGIDSGTARSYKEALKTACSTFRELTISGKPTFVISRSDLENARAVFFKNRNRYLDVRKATGEQLDRREQPPRRIIRYETPLEVGTALLDGRFETDCTNIFNPEYQDSPAPVFFAKHDLVKKDGAFTYQQAVETAVYSDLRDLFRCFESKTNFELLKPKRRITPKEPEVKGAKANTYKIIDAESYVLQLAENLSKNDRDKLLAAYDTAVQEADNWEKAKTLVQVIKDLKIKYNQDLFAAYVLLLSENYEEIIGQIRSVNITEDNQEQLVRTVTKLTLVKQELAEDKAAYLALCAKYRVKPDEKFNQIVRIIRINLLKISAETRKMIQDITAEAEALAIIK